MSLWPCKSIFSPHLLNFIQNLTSFWHPCFFLYFRSITLIFASRWRPTSMSSYAALFPIKHLRLSFPPGHSCVHLYFTNSVITGLTYSFIRPLVKLASLQSQLIYIHWRSQLISMWMLSDLKSFWHNLLTLWIHILFQTVVFQVCLVI